MTRSNQIVATLDSCHQLWTRVQSCLQPKYQVLVHTSAARNVPDLKALFSYCFESRQEQEVKGKSVMATQLIWSFRKRLINSHKPVKTPSPFRATDSKCSSLNREHLLKGCGFLQRISRQILLGWRGKDLHLMPAGRREAVAACSALSKSNPPIYLRSAL